MNELCFREGKMTYESVLDNFIEGTSSALANLGLNKTAAQIYSFIAVANRVLCLGEISDFLKISRGNASINVRLLEDLGAIKKVWQKGDRKDYYELLLDVWSFFGLLIYRKSTDTVNDIVGTLDNSIEKIQLNMKNFTETQTDQSRKLMQNLQQYKALFGYCTEITKEINDLNCDIKLQKLRTIWSVLKPQLK